jgi:hypothetical protein
MLHRRRVLAWLATMILLPVMARAHHGWAWAEDGEFSLTGVLRSARLGNPHGELEVEAADGLWTA